MKPARSNRSSRSICSSVDSGNLAGHLLTLGAGLREQAEEKIFTPEIFAGLRDTVGFSEIWPAKKPRWPNSTRIGNKRLPICARRLPCWKGDGQATEIAASLAAKRRTQSVGPNSEAQLRGAFGGHAFPRAVAGFANPKRDSQEVPTPPRGQRKRWRGGGGKLEEKIAQLDQAPTLREVANFEQSLCPLIEAALQTSRRNPPHPGRKNKASAELSLPA
jgi:hypothetical protein